MAPITRNTAKNNAQGIKNSQKLIRKEKKETNNKIKLKTIKNKFDIIENLPLEISQMILLLLGKDDVSSSYNCSRKWRNVMSGEYYWRKRCDLDNYHEPSENKTSTFYQQYLEEFDSRWQGMYSYYHMLKNNWKNNNFKKITLSVFSSNDPVAIHYLDEKVIIISTTTFCLKMLDSSTGNEIQTNLGCHIRPITQVFKIDNFLISYVNCSLLKVWDLSKGGICVTEMMMSFYVQTMCVCKNVIAFVTGFQIQQVFVYDFKGNLMYHEFTNEGLSTCLCVNDNIVVIGTSDGILKIFKLNSEPFASTQVTYTLPMGIQRIKIKNGFLCVLYPTFIFVYDSKTLRYLHIIVNNYSEEINYVHQNKIVSDDGDRHLVTLWDITTGHRVLKIRNRHVMNFLTGNRNYILTEVPYKKLIQVWCCNTQKLVTEISLEAIGLKNHLIIRAYLSNSKLVLVALGKEHDKPSLVLLNFENTENVVHPIIDY